MNHSTIFSKLANSIWQEQCLSRGKWSRDEIKNCLSVCFETPLKCRNLRSATHYMLEKYNAVWPRRVFSTKETCPLFYSASVYATKKKYRLLHRLKPWKSHLFSIIPSFLICKMKINFRATQLPSCFWVPWNLNSFQYFLFLNKKKKLISNCDPKVYSKLLVRRKKLPLVTFRHPSEHVISYNMDIVFEFNTLWVVFFALIQI